MNSLQNTDIGRLDTGDNSADLKRRYVLLGVVLFLALIVILGRTSALQLSDRQAEQVAETRGSGTQMRVNAPRGDIVDISGQPIAYSEAVNMLYLASADLDSTELNAELLEISRHLNDSDVEQVRGLTAYFDISSDSAAGDPTFVFKRPIDEIKRWQSNKDLFNLAETEDKRAKNRFRTDPAEFFEYLLYDKFNIEDEEAGGDRRYTDLEAFEIMKLRYILLENNWRFLQGAPIKLAGPLTPELSAMFSEQNQRFPGVLTVREYQRKYSPDSRYFSHVLGYTGAITAAEYELMKDFGYSIDDTVGKAGVEYWAEQYLHQTPGTMPYRTWQKDEDGFDFVQGTGGQEPLPGANVRLTLDSGMQQHLLRVLQDNCELHRKRDVGKARSAAAVMLDLKTGAVLAMGSIPDYDPTMFERAPYDDEAAAEVERYLTDNDNKPLLNRCVSEIYSPGSTFKPVTAAAGLEMGVITPSSSDYECKGTEEIAYRMWRCYEKPIEGHGILDLNEAMVTSCNLYFFKLGLDIKIDNLEDMAKRLGFGNYTGIDLPNEAKGIVPGREVKRLTRAKPEDQGWFPADTCQSAIGQFDNAYTLIQLCRGIGAIATGDLVTPHIIKEITAVDGSIIKPEVINNSSVGLSTETINAVRTAMGGLKDHGGPNTVRNFKDYPINVSAKTGTAEVESRDGKALTTNAVYVAFAPTENPQVAIACLVEEGYAGDILSDIAREMFDYYFDLPPRDRSHEDLYEAEDNHSGTVDEPPVVDTPDEGAEGEPDEEPDEEPDNTPEEDAPAEP